MKEMQFTVERGGPLLPVLLEHVKGSRNHVKSLLARGQVQVDGAAVRRHDHPLAPANIAQMRGSFLDPVAKFLPSKERS